MSAQQAQLNARPSGQPAAESATRHDPKHKVEKCPACDATIDAGQPCPACNISEDRQPPESATPSLLGIARRILARCPIDLDLHRLGTVNLFGKEINALRLAIEGEEQRAIKINQAHDDLSEVLEDDSYSAADIRAEAVELCVVLNETGAVRQQDAGIAGLAGQGVQTPVARPGCTVTKMCLLDAGHTGDCCPCPF